MAISTVFIADPVLGPPLTMVSAAPFYDVSNLTSPSYQLGTVVHGSDGHDYCFVKASADIAAASSPGTQVTITEPAFTAAAGSGGWYAPVAGVTSGQYFHARRGTL